MKAPGKFIVLNRDDVKRYYSYLPDYEFELTQYWESNLTVLDFNINIYIPTRDFGFVDLTFQGNYSLKLGVAENGIPTRLIRNVQGDTNWLDYSVKVLINEAKMNKQLEIDEIQLQPDGIIDRRSFIYKDFYIEVNTEIKEGKKYV